MTEQVKDFDAEVEISEKTFPFKICGEVFHARDNIPPSVWLGPQAGTEFLINLLRSVILPEEREKFDTIALDPDARWSSKTLSNIVNWLNGEMSGRPTASPTSSGDGRDSTSTG